MGLDMYLNKKTYVGNEYAKVLKRELVEIKPNEKHEEAIKKIKTDRIAEIVERVGYWRKANHIHSWFVENVQEGRDECQESYVGVEKLEELLKLCKKVIKGSKLVKGKVTNGYRILSGGKEEPILEDGQYIKDPSVAKKLLPCTKGFFFGGTEYDQYYYEQMEETIKILEEAIKEDGEYYYQASW